MNIFITGASGQTGPAIVTELIAAGHNVTGLARSEQASHSLHNLGAAMLPGLLDDLETLERGARLSDGVIHMAFGSNSSTPEIRSALDCAAIHAMGRGLVGTGKPLVITSGTLAMSPGKVATEQDTPDPQSIGSHRIPGEQACLALAKMGVRAAVLRLAPTVHGPRDHGFIPYLISAARRTGVSAYIGEGANRWPAVHRKDAATLFRLAVEKASAGTILHGVGEGEVVFQTIAQLIGRKLHIPVVSIDSEDALNHFQNPFFAKAFATDSPASSTYTRELLDWNPGHATLLQDLANGDYFTPRAA